MSKTIYRVGVSLPPVNGICHNIMRTQNFFCDPVHSPKIVTSRHRMPNVNRLREHASIDFGEIQTKNNGPF